MVEKSILTVITDGFSHSCDKISQSDVEEFQMSEQMSESDDGWRIKQDRYLIDPYSQEAISSRTKQGYYDRSEFQTTQNLLRLDIQDHRRHHHRLLCVFQEGRFQTDHVSHLRRYLFFRLRCDMENN